MDFAPTPKTGKSIDFQIWELQTLIRDLQSQIDEAKKGQNPNRQVGSPWYRSCCSALKHKRNELRALVAHKRVSESTLSFEDPQETLKARLSTLTDLAKTVKSWIVERTEPSYCTEELEEQMLLKLEELSLLWPSEFG